MYKKSHQLHCWMVLGSPSFYIVCNLASDLSRDYKCHVTTLDFGVLCRSVEASRLLREETIDATVLENSLKKSHLETIMFSHRKSIFECNFGNFWRENSKIWLSNSTYKTPLNSIETFLVISKDNDLSTQTFSAKKKTALQSLKFSKKVF